jgi:hypothetical protein
VFLEHKRRYRLGEIEAAMRDAAMAIPDKTRTVLVPAVVTGADVEMISGAFKGDHREIKPRSSPPSCAPLRPTPPTRPRVAHRLCPQG